MMATAAAAADRRRWRRWRTRQCRRRRRLIRRWQDVCFSLHDLETAVSSKSFLCFVDILVNLQVPLELGLKARAVSNITSWVSGTESWMAAAEAAALGAAGQEVRGPAGARDIAPPAAAAHGHGHGRGGAGSGDIAPSAAAAAAGPGEHGRGSAAAPSAGIQSPGADGRLPSGPGPTARPGRGAPHPRALPDHLLQAGPNALRRRPGRRRRAEGPTCRRLRRRETHI